MWRNVIVFLIFITLVSSVRAANFIVAADGSGNFTTMQAAIDACPDGVRSYIFIKNGTYYGLTSIGSKAAASSKLISLIGENRDSVILTYDKAMPEVATFEQTCAFQIYAKNFYAENVTFQNSAGNTGQALALYTAGDMAILKNCKLTGYQDTYRSKKGTRGYLLNCWVEGAVDFIYAGGTLIFDDCTINCIRSGGFITAPEDAYATVPKASTASGIFLRLGFLFRNCTIQGPATVPANAFYLGRPWGDYAGSTYVNCKLSNQVNTAGWATMGSSTYLTACFCEYNSMDPNGTPVDTTKRVNWSKQLKKSDVDNHLNPAAFYAKSYTTTFEPLGLSVSPDAPTEVSIMNGNTLKWNSVNGAVAYMIFFNKKFIGIANANEYNISGLSGVFEIKSVNSLGVLSNFSTPVTEVKVPEFENLPYTLKNGMLSLNSEIVSAELYNLSGKKLMFAKNKRNMDVSKHKNSVLILKTSNCTGTEKCFKLKIE